MDSDTICFQNLKITQKLFQEKFDDLIKMGNESKSKRLLNVVSLNKREFYFKNVGELFKEANRQQIEEATLLKGQNECSKHIADISNRIKAMGETLHNLENEESVEKDELTQIKKPLIKAIKKYSTTFNMYIEVKKHETDMNLASVKFSSKKDVKAVDFLIDRKNKRILDFDAQWLLSEKEAQELKNKALTENGLNIELILSRLRHFAINAIY